MREPWDISGGMAALGASQPSAGSNIVADKDVSETKPDGNNVTLEDQLLQLGQVPGTVWCRRISPP